MITFFQSSTAVAAGNSTITLSWQSNGDVARIDQVNQANAITASFSVTPTGELPVTLPNTEPQVRYRLVVSRGGQELSQEVTVQVQVACSVPWFFAGQSALPSGVCPAGAAQNVSGKYQPFERGFMVNALINGENRVYGFNATNGQYAVYLSGWDGTSTHTSGCGTAPAGFINPQDVFNWLYHTQLGTVGLWCDATNGIGWAIGNADLGNFMTYQFEAPPSTAFYININGVGLFRVSGTPNTGTWSYIPPQ